MFEHVRGKALCIDKAVRVLLLVATPLPLCPHSLSFVARTLWRRSWSDTLCGWLPTAVDDLAECFDPLRGPRNTPRWCLDLRPRAVAHGSIEGGQVVPGGPRSSRTVHGQVARE